MTGANAPSDRLSPAALVADSAGLLVVFYGPRAGSVMPELHLRLYQELAHDPTAAVSPAPWPAPPWADPTGRSILHRFEPKAAAGHDTTIISVALNAPGDVVEAWAALRRQLLSLVDAAALKGVWGCTLVHQAVLAPGADPERALAAVLPDLRRMPPLEKLSALARADLAGGWVWLLDVPLGGSGLASSTVYVALCPPDEDERAFLQAVFQGPTGILFLPDLIAHKGYFERRQHLGDGARDDWFRELVSLLRKTTDNLLADLGQRVAETDEVDDLARAYGALAKRVPVLKQLHISLRQQVHNLGRQEDFFGDNAIFAFHRRHLETAAYELELKVANGQDALDAAQAAGDLAQVRIERVQERRQQFTQTLLAVVGAAFAVPTLVDRAAAGRFLGALGISEPTGGYCFWRLLGTQAGIMVLVACLAGVAAHRLGNWWAQRDAPRRA